MGVHMSNDVDNVAMIHCEVTEFAVNMMVNMRTFLRSACISYLIHANWHNFLTNLGATCGWGREK